MSCSDLLPLLSLCLGCTSWVEHVEQRLSFEEDLRDDFCLVDVLGMHFPSFSCMCVRCYAPACLLFCSAWKVRQQYRGAGALVDVLVFTLAPGCASGAESLILALPNKIVQVVNYLICVSNTWPNFFGSFLALMHIFWFSPVVLRGKDVGLIPSQF